MSDRTPIDEAIAALRVVQQLAELPDDHPIVRNGDRRPRQDAYMQMASCAALVSIAVSLDEIAKRIEVER